jgi:hypothetical protein
MARWIYLSAKTKRSAAAQQPVRIASRTTSRRLKAAIEDFGAIHNNEDHFARIISPLCQRWSVKSTN